MLGRRSKKYYEKLKLLPNVKLINPNILTNDVINNENCELVTAVSGTSGLEAALLGKSYSIFRQLLQNVAERKACN